jgi:hypothetical protein
LKLGRVPIIGRDDERKIENLEKLFGHDGLPFQGVAQN